MTILSPQIEAHRISPPQIETHRKYSNAFRDNDPVSLPARCEKETPAENSRKRKISQAMGVRNTRGKTEEDSEERSRTSKVTFTKNKG